MIKPIPTYYNGQQFRSRLEAKWAAFFDVLGWSWVYEPCDFNGWIPDFVLRGKTTVFVEVKPTEVFLEDVANKIDAAGCPDEVLLVGYGPGPCAEDDGWLPHHLRLGWLRTRVAGAAWQWHEASLGRWIGYEMDMAHYQPYGTMLGFSVALTGHCHDRITGLYDGECFGEGFDVRGVVDGFWKEAGNRVQWKKPPRRPSS